MSSDSSPPPRRRGPRSDAVANRQRLAVAAGEVFARIGPSAQLEDIAQQAGLGVGTAYRHLGSRDAALHEVLAARIADMVAIADRADRIADPWEAVCFYLAEMAESVAGDRGVTALMTNRGVSPEQVDRLRGLIDPRTSTLLDRAKASGELRADVAVTDVPMILACVDRVAGDTAAVAPEVWRRFLTITLDGLRVSRPSVTAMPAPPLTDHQFSEVGAATATRVRAR